MNNETATVKTIGYFRTSGDDDQKVSIESQESAYLEAVKKLGWQSCGMFQDKGVSGRAYESDAGAIIDLDKTVEAYLCKKSSTKKTRKGLTQAFETAKLSGANYIWCRDITRFCRNLDNSFLENHLKTRLHDLGLQLFCEDQGLIDWSLLSTKITQSVKGIVENDSVIGKAKDSMTSRNDNRNQGLLYSAAIGLGMKSIGKGQIIPIPEELATVKQMFDLFLAGNTITSIRNTLEQKGIKPRTAKKWLRCVILQCLKREWYAGMMENTKGELIESLVFQSVKVVSLKDWQKVQDKLANNHSRDQTKIHPLTGLVICKPCQKAMHIYLTRGWNKSRIQYYYRCPDCGQIIRETMGTPSLVGQAKGYLSVNGNETRGTGLLECLAPYVLPARLEALRLSQGTAKTQEDITAAMDILAKLQERRKQDYQALQAGDIDKDIFDSLKKDWIKVKESTEKRLNALRESLSLSNSFDFDKAIKDIEEVSGPEYRQLINLVIQKIEIDRTVIVISFTKSDIPLTLPRLAIKNSRLCPIPVMGVYDRELSHSYRVRGEVIQSIPTGLEGRVIELV